MFLGEEKKNEKIFKDFVHSCCGDYVRKPCGVLQGAHG
jgi:hypothetical protein